MRPLRCHLDRLGSPPHNVQPGIKCCSDIAREIPSAIVYEDDLEAGFRDVSPQVLTHILIGPKRPIVIRLWAQKNWPAVFAAGQW